MIKVVNATEAKNHFGDIIQQAYLHGQHLIIKRDEIPVVAIVPISDYERIIPSNQISAKLEQSVKEEQARQRLLNLLEKVHSKIPGVSEKEANRDITKAIKSIRSRR